MHVWESEYSLCLINDNIVRYGTGPFLGQTFKIEGIIIADERTGYLEKREKERKLQIVLRNKPVHVTELNFLVHLVC